MAETIHRYFILNKPNNMVSQFVSSDDVILLKAIDFSFPDGTHAIGRLDSNSEGLLLLTTNKTITRKLFNREAAHTRKYLVQVRHTITPEAIKKLRSGVSIRIKGGGYYTTMPCEVELVTDAAYSHLQHAKANAPGSWILITLTEGKYHQVRKMVDAVGHKCKRLIRVAIEDIKLDDLQSGEVREMNEDVFFRLLKLEK